MGRVVGAEDERAVVVFPQPLSPTSPSGSPSSKRKLTLSTARTRPTVRLQEALPDREELLQPATFAEKPRAGARVTRRGSSSPHGVAQRCSPARADPSARHEFGSACGKGSPWPDGGVRHRP